MADRSSQVPSDVSEYTDVHFTNSSAKSLKLHAVTIWDGSPLPLIQNVIEAGQTLNFRHYAASNGGSVGGLEFKVTDKNCTLVVAWCNNGLSNKVYSDILHQDDIVFWAQIKENLERSGKDWDVTKFGYKCTLNIDPHSGMPTMTGTFKEATGE